jgi:hypothetical protein
MFYAILAYHADDAFEPWTPEQDAALMKDLLAVHGKLVADGAMGPAARLTATADARTLRGPGEGTVVDGPFAETKEQLLGLYVVDCADHDEAVEIARKLRAVNPTAVYETRPIALYVPGAPLKP